MTLSDHRSGSAPASGESRGDSAKISWFESGIPPRRDRTIYGAKGTDIFNYGKWLKEARESTGGFVPRAISAADWASRGLDWLLDKP